VIPAIAAAVLLTGGGIFATVKVSQHHNSAATPTIATPPPNTGPFTGTYTADLGPTTRFDGGPAKNVAPPGSETWSLRSACRPGGCVATAARRSGDTTLVSTLVFDDVGGRWLAVGLGSGTCDNAPAERWEVFTLQPHPDGTLTGDYSSTAANTCGSKRAVTFTRTGDVDVNSLPDPATQPPRAVSAAEALHGHYHETVTSAGGQDEYDYVVRTDCLRTGDRCMSYFNNPDRALPLVFADGKWSWDRDAPDTPCLPGGTTHAKLAATYPLPAPPQDPITLLTGHGYVENTGLCAHLPGAFDDNFVRTGD
jgi:serine/threonine-protein kinase